MKQQLVLTHHRKMQTLQKLLLKLQLKVLQLILQLKLILITSLTVKLTRKLLIRAKHLKTLLTLLLRLPIIRTVLIQQQLTLGQRQVNMHLLKLVATKQMIVLLSTKPLLSLQLRQKVLRQLLALIVVMYQHFRLISLTVQLTMLHSRMHKARMLKITQKLLMQR